MQTNTEKFQLILFSRNKVAGSLNVGGTAIKSEPVVKLLGVSIDRALSFSDHVTLLCHRQGSICFIPYVQCANNRSQAIVVQIFNPQSF